MQSHSFERTWVGKQLLRKDLFQTSISHLCAWFWGVSKGGHGPGVSAWEKVIQSRGGCTELSTAQGKAECLQRAQYLRIDSHCEWGCGPRAISPQTACLFSLWQQGGDRESFFHPLWLPSSFPTPPSLLPALPSSLFLPSPRSFCLLSWFSFLFFPCAASVF